MSGHITGLPREDGPPTRANGEFTDRCANNARAEGVSQLRGIAIGQRTAILNGQDHRRSDLGLQPRKRLCQGKQAVRQWATYGDVFEELLLLRL